MSKIIIITGSRKGIGRHLVEHYLGKGMNVCGCSRGESDLVHSNYDHYCLDVADENRVIRMVADITRKYGKIDCLINNAGIASMNHSFLTPVSVLEKVLSTNVLGTFLFCREVAKVMARKKSGRIVNFATVATPMKLEGESVYAASKAAVENLTKLLAKEFAAFNITINALGPTPVYTDLIKNVPKEKIDALLSMQAIHKLGTMDDIANVCDFFISPRSAFITGQVLYLGGVTN